MTDRREFLRRMAAGAAFVAPVVHTLVAPRGLTAQGSSNTGKGGGGGTGGGGKNMLTVEPQGSTAPGSKAPWEVAPPGSTGGGG